MGEWPNHYSLLIYFVSFVLLVDTEKGGRLLFIAIVHFFGRPCGTFLERRPKMTSISS
jgi:hypothetical protein